jgi:hypothetical protein
MSEQLLKELIEVTDLLLAQIQSLAPT